jgi:CheY-like chemotaxis protein
MDKRTKSVLIIDDDDDIQVVLKDQFYDSNHQIDCPYSFQIDSAQTAYGGVEKLRANSYDVIIMDVRMPDKEQEQENKRSGLDLALALASPEIARSLGEVSGYQSPVRIIITVWEDFGQCVEAMRNGAWDYILKKDTHMPFSQAVVDSVITGLRHLDQRREQEELIAHEWLPWHFVDLQHEYGGKLIAIWHKPEIEVIASGDDAFKLEGELKAWRVRQKTWDAPFIVRIPKQS